MFDWGVSEKNSNGQLKGLVDRFARLVAEKVGRILESRLHIPNKDSDEVGDQQKSTQAKYCTITQAANFLGFSRSTIYRLVNSGELPSYTLPGSNKQYVRAEDVEALMEEVPTNREDDFQAFEARVRKAVKRGRELRPYWEEFRKKKQNPTISEFAKYLDEQDLGHLIRKGVIMGTDDELQ